MSTVKESLKYLWTAEFKDGHVIQQPADDKYSKHDDTKDQNPSAFKDVQEYDGELLRFSINGVTGSYALDFSTMKFNFNGSFFWLDGKIKEPKLIFFRNVDWKHINGVAQDPVIVSYSLGYEYLKDGKTVKRIVTLE